MNEILTMAAYLVLYAIISFFQNAIFTIVSRSRNSGNSKLHKKVAYLSNGIWFINSTFMIKLMWEYLIKNPNFWVIIIAGLVYVKATAEGSAVAMRWWARHVESKDDSYKVGAKMKE